MSETLSLELCAQFDAAFEDILQRLADGATLLAACEAHNLNRRSFRRYATAAPERLVAYDRAREAQTEALMDELKEVADSTTIDPRLQANRIKALTWMIEKRDPARYGQKASIEHTIKTPDLALAIASSDKREQALLARRAALALPAQVAVFSPVPTGSDAAWAELLG